MERMIRRGGMIPRSEVRKRSVHGIAEHDEGTGGVRPVVHPEPDLEFSFLDEFAQA